MILTALHLAQTFWEEHAARMHSVLGQKTLGDPQYMERNSYPQPFEVPVSLISLSLASKHCCVAHPRPAYTLQFTRDMKVTSSSNIFSPRRSTPKLVAFYPHSLRKSTQDAFSDVFAARHQLDFASRHVWAQRGTARLVRDRTAHLLATAHIISKASCAAPALVFLDLMGKNSSLQ